MIKTTNTQNPLLDQNYLPNFRSIRAVHCLPAIEEVLATSNSEIEHLETLSKTATWENFAEQLENIEEKIDRIWSTISHLNSVQDSKEFRLAYQTCMQALTEFHTRLGQNEKLFMGYKTILNSSNFSSLNQAKQTIIKNSVRDFRLAGAELNETDQKRYSDIALELSELSNQFSQNVLDATEDWHLDITNKQDLSGLPDTALSSAQQKARLSDLNEAWRFGLDTPSYIAILRYADNQLLREKMYKAYATRASEFEKKDRNNGPLIQKIVALKQEKAKLLGFDTYAELAVVTKMTDSPQQIFNFLEELLSYAKPKADAELAELKEFTLNQYQVENLEPWDISYYSEKLKEHSFSFDSEQIKQYFPVDKVINGMFEIASRLFKITVKPSTETKTWHDDVLAFEVKNANGDIIGRLFADLYVRKGKRGGAWMGVCRHRRKTLNNTQLPVAFLTCNFAPASIDQPALLTHDDVETLFHEFGHTLHHLLTQVDEMSVAGINGVAWDAVELPSQFLENWCWHKESLPLISAHYQTGKALPDELLNKMLAAKTFQSGMACVRQIEFALFDITLYSDYEINSYQDIQSLLDKIRLKTAVIIPPDYHRFQNSFSHIFAGGYSAGYYSYKWSEVLSADAFSRFEEEGIFNETTGNDFLKYILARGGEVEPKQLFEKFRGRQPNINALLKHTNLVPKD